eukprot:9814495-Alexandrium_andersonii.AAC.1
MEGHKPDLRRAQVWTWDEAQRVAEGVQLVLEAEERGRSIVPVFPAFNPDAVQRHGPGTIPAQPSAAAARVQAASIGERGATGLTPEK